MNIKTFEEAQIIVTRAKDLTSDINRLSQDKGQPREISLLMAGALDQGIVVVGFDQEALGDCVVSQCHKLILRDLRAERTGLKLRFQEL